MRVLLVQPNSRYIHGLTSPPLGLMFISSVLERAGHDVKIIDRNIDFFSLHKIASFEPQIVGVSSLTGPMLDDGIKVAKWIRERYGKDVPIVWGGVHASILPEQTISNDFVDFVIRGEGEYAFLQLVNSIEEEEDYTGIDGLVYKKNGELFVNKDRPFIKDLDKLPYTPWRSVNYNEYLSLESTFVTSRGCPHNCAFCYNLEFNKRKWRGWSAERVLKEIERVKKLRQNKNLKFYDDNFTANVKRFYKIVDNLSRDHTLWFETRIEMISEKFLDHLDKFKKVWIFLGVESGSERLLKKMNKGITIDMIKNAFKLLEKRKNIAKTASVMVGLPTETLEELIKSAKLQNKLNPTRFSYRPYVPYPGSPFYKECVDEGLIDPPDSLEGWGEFHKKIKGAKLSVSLTEKDYEFINKLTKSAWYSTIKNIVKEKQYRKFYLRFRDFRPHIMKYIDYIDELLMEKSN